MRYELLNGDCRIVMRSIPDSSVDSVVTDPPYELGFMGRSWDSTGVAYDVETWRQVLRVLKPGGHLLAFGGTRTYHRLACAAEDAGFEIRDQIGWLYGSGFPKSRNLDGEWAGWGTALKPAWEPLVMARKPLVGTVALNVEMHGVGALNIDGCRVETADNLNGGAYSGTIRQRDEYSSTDSAVGAVALSRLNRGVGEYMAPSGRWPANVIHDGSDEVLAAFPNAPGQQGNLTGHSRNRTSRGIYGDMPPARDAIARGDTGSAARFFYCAKASRKERGTDNTHPTVKPIALMRYLVRLVTPHGGLVLDPFLGSGTTGCAAMLEGMRFVGIEKDTEGGYMGIAESRIAEAARA